MKKLLLICLALSVMLFVTGCTQEGYIKTDDCRNNVTVKDGDVDTYFHTYTCSTSKNKNNQIVSGQCCRAELNNDTCEIAYCYDVTSEVSCGSNAHPDAGSDSSCSCDYGYHVNPKDTVNCIINN